MNLLPFPRSLTRHAGWYTLPARAVMHLDASLPRENVMLPIAERLRSATRPTGVDLELLTGPSDHPRLAIAAIRSETAPKHPEGYRLSITQRGIKIAYRQAGGLRAGIATLRQLLQQYGRRLPNVTITDYPDFARRGVMLDVSRGRVPRLQTLFELADHLADFKINEFQLYTEHTFAYRNYEPVWESWGPLTGDDILRLDAHCRSLGIDLVPNQNSFGHLRYWLEYPPLRRLREVSRPYPGGPDFLRYPTTLAPNHPGTLPFIRELYDELLPHFTSDLFNVGCDETWDLGRGKSKLLCEQKGKGRVYVQFLKSIHREVIARGRRMMFWGDIILNHPELIKELPRNLIALNWGYEAQHPFSREAGMFASSKIPFYVCPGTSTWMSLIGRYDNAEANLRSAAEAGRQCGALGYLNTDWGDGGHPQPLAVSYLPYLTGAALSWCANSFKPHLLIPVLSRTIFADSTERMATAAMALGVAHRKFNYFAPNVTPFGTAIAAPPPARRELFCRDGLKYYARIPPKNIRAALEAVEQERARLARAQPANRIGTTLSLEFDLAARMAVQSCKVMLWQQYLAAGQFSAARRFAKSAIRELTELDHDFNSYWPSRNNGTPKHCSPFLRWRIADYRAGRLHFSPEAAAQR